MYAHRDRCMYAHHEGGETKVHVHFRPGRIASPEDDCSTSYQSNNQSESNQQVRMTRASLQDHVHRMIFMPEVRKMSQFENRNFGPA